MTTRSMTVLMIFPVMFAAHAQSRDERTGFSVRGRAIEIALSPDGDITGVRSPRTGWHRNVRGMTTLDSCVRTGTTTVRRTSAGGLQFRKAYFAPDGTLRLSVVDTFTPERSSIRWETEITGGVRPWSTGICTSLGTPDTAGVRFWTSWGDPDQVSPEAWAPHPDGWECPLLGRPLRDMHLIYGGHFGKGGGYSVPVYGLMYPAQGRAIVLAMSPEDPLLDVHMVTTAGGDVRQTRNFNRLQAGRPVRFTMHIFLSPCDWRGIMAFMTARYPAWFLPPAPNADRVSGLGAYSSWEGPIDAAKYRAMGGIVNWKASFDFSYMGMFIPPVASDTTPWKRFDATSGGEPAPRETTYTTIARMASYAARMKSLGFATLNYFNVTEFGGFSEFGKSVAYPDPHASGDADVWRNPTAFLYDHFPGALLFGAFGDDGWSTRSPAQLMFPRPSFRDRPYWSWGGAVATDVGDSAYAEFLLDQGRLHVGKFPDAQGIAIDRYDWLNEYNAHADDGATWIAGRPARALLNSYKRFIPRLSRIMHGRGKVMFCNPHMCRLEMMRWIDGVYTEFGHIGFNLNMAAFLTPDKPLLCWTPDSETVMKAPDRYFQRHLLMGAFPTAPFPGNDHTIGPSPAVERYYLDYGMMFSLLHGRKWVLIPGIVDAPADEALCNLFTCPGRVVIPVVLGRADSAHVRVTHPGELGLARIDSASLWFPGATAPVKTRIAASGDGLEMTVPLRRGCAFLVIERRRVAHTPHD